MCGRNTPKDLSHLTKRSKVKFTLEQAMKAERRKKVKLYPFFNLGPRWGA
jgi:hypothetical protein